MQAYYTVIMLLCLMALGVLCVLVWENNRMSATDKELLYLAYFLIALSTFVEWWGGRLDGRTDVPIWAMSVVKCVDFILKPMAGGALVAQMRVRNRWLTALEWILIFNTVLQIVAAINGWMVVVDRAGHFGNGVLYPAYITACLAVVTLVSMESILYGRSFRKQNRLSLYAVMLFVGAGIAMQVLLPMRPKAVCVAMTMGAALMFIHYAEFSSLEMDDRLAAQKVQIDTDALTGLRSRYAYLQAIEGYGAGESLPDDLVAFVVDINSLKQVNDELGHEAGDELIIGAARCLETVFEDAECCYRTGGDEFVVLVNMSGDDAVAALERLDNEVRSWHGERVASLAVSAGHALVADCEESTIEALVRKADVAMYSAKAAYYRGIGRSRDRRAAR